jgi:hypothetical protein
MFISHPSHPPCARNLEVKGAKFMHWRRADGRRRRWLAEVLPELAEVLAAVNFKFPAKETAPSEAPARPSKLDSQEPDRSDVKKPGCEVSDLS